MSRRLVAVCSIFVACGGKAVIDTDSEEPVLECFDAQSCCEAAVALQDDKCPRDDGVPRVCAIDTVPDTCVPFLGDVYRCIYDNADSIVCEAGSARLRCGTCTEELEAAGEPCGQSGSCAP